MTATSKIAKNPSKIRQSEPNYLSFTLRRGMACLNYIN